MIFYKRLDEILPRLLEKQFFGTSHIESEESDKNLHWKPVLHNLFPKEKLLFQVLEKALENNLVVTLAFSYILGIICWKRLMMNCCRNLKYYAKAEKKRARQGSG